MAPSPAAASIAPPTSGLYPDRRSIGQAESLLRDGWSLVLFPEGERAIDGTVRIFKKGAAILAHHLQVPLVPVALSGVYALGNVVPLGQ